MPEGAQQNVRAEQRNNSFALVDLNMPVCKVSHIFVFECTLNAFIWSMNYVIQGIMVRYANLTLILDII